MHRTSSAALFSCAVIGSARGEGPSELVVEVAAGDPLAIFGGHVDAARREQVHAVGDHLDLAVEPVHETGGEIHQTAGDRVVGALQVHDHGDPVLEPVGD